MPPALVYDLALSLAEDGKAAEGEKLFENRFFARQEGGTNVRQIYLEVALLNALQLARAGRREEALNAAHNLGKERSGMAFTRDGLEPFLNDARTEFYLGEIESIAGAMDAAREHWRKAGGFSGGTALNAAFAVARRPPSGRECRRHLEDPPGGDPLPLRQRPRQWLRPRRLRARLDARRISVARTKPSPPCAPCFSCPTAACPITWRGWPCASCLNRSRTAGPNAG